MNQIIPKNQLKLTKGGEPSKYTYYGDSGMSFQVLCGFPSDLADLVLLHRQGCQLLLLPTMHLAHLSPPGGYGPRHHHRPHRSSSGGP